MILDKIMHSAGKLSAKLDHKIEQAIDNAEAKFNKAAASTWHTLSGLSTEQITKADGLNEKLDEINAKLTGALKKVLH